MTRQAPVIITFMGKRWHICPGCQRSAPVRSDGKYERHNQIKGQRGLCPMSLQPSGRRDVRKPDKNDRVALMKVLKKGKGR